MKQTEHYGLNQWELADRIRMEDFNCDNAKIDAALGTMAQALLGAGNCILETFQYTGNGKYGSDNPTTIHFPRKPTFFVILADNCTVYGGTTGNSDFVLLHALGNGEPVFISSTFTWNGSTLKITNTTHVIARLQANELNKVYRVFAFTALASA